MPEMSLRNIFVLLISLGLLSCGKEVQSGPFTPQVEVATLETPKDFQPYFNYRNTSLPYRDPYRNVLLKGDSFEDLLIEAVKKANHSVEIAVQEYRLPRLAKVLASLSKKISVRLVLENTYKDSWYELSQKFPTGEQKTQLTDYQKEKLAEGITFLDRNGDTLISTTEAEEWDGLHILKKSRASILFDDSNGGKGSGLMHHKFVIIDNRELWVTSANFTLSDFYGDYGKLETHGNANSMIRVKNSQMISEFSKEFKELWLKKFKLQKKFRGRIAIKSSTGNGSQNLGFIQFSPTSKKQPYSDSTNGLIFDVLEKAKTSVKMALFVFSEARLAKAISKLNSDSIFLLIDPGFAYRDYSVMYNLLGVSYPRENCATPDPGTVRISSIAPNGRTPSLARGDKFHHKFAVLDSESVIMGSHNWSESANRQNDESILWIKDKALAKEYEDQFDYWFKGARSNIPMSALDEWSKRVSNCFN